MSGGFGSLPIFAQDDAPALPTGLLGFGQPAPVSAQDPSVPQATPPGFTGYTSPTPPTGAPTPILNPNAAATGASLISALGPNSAEAATPDPNDIRGRFISTLQQGGLTNPNGLGAVAAYAQHESGYSPSNITGSWSDPSQSGAPGTSGGILSWRADRLANMKAFTAGASDPVAAQANFLLQENPQLTQALQNAKSPQEANALMAGAWKFQGYDQPGGENAARLATTQAYANSLGSGQALPATGRPRGASMGSTAQQGGFGLGGIQAQGSAVPGQASLTPDVATLSGQPTALDGSQGQQEDASPYGGIASALKSIAGGQQRQGQKAAGAGGMAAPKMDGRAMTLQQARQQFDAGRFYSMLPRGGRMA